MSAADATQPFELNPKHDTASLRSAYARDGWVSIERFLQEQGAHALRTHLLARRDWLLVLNAGEKVYEIPCSAPLSEEQQRTLDALVAKAALQGFQYRFETVRVPDAAEERRARGTLLDAFAAFLSSPPVLDFLASVTAASADFADAQGTVYRPGHFLTRHDDDVAGKRRHAAYVFGLTPDWRAEWGGLLLFHDAQGDIERGFVPGFNVLRLFRVPRSHSVSAVWPHAPVERLSVTGWLRSRG